MRNMKRYLSILLSVVLVFSFSISATANEAAPNPSELPSTESQLPSAGLNYDQYPSLKDVYKDYFLVGTVGSLSGPRSELIAHHFNSYTPENEMKPQSVQSVKGVFTFDNLNSLLGNVTALSNDIQLIGHTLAWHSQSPNWMWDSPNFDRETALDNLNTHIQSVLGEYGEQLHSMDVVNEAIGNANPNDWRASLNKGEGWVLALGSDWVELAFLEAARIVDENGWDTKLYYNDFGLNSSAKAQTVYEMVKEINEKYADTRPNGKPLIEGIGMQGHYNGSTNAEDVEASIKLFATLPGVSVSITELDLEWPNLGSLTPEQEVEQAQKYAQLFQIFKNYAAGSGNASSNPKVIERVTLWGTNDGNSWKGEGRPLLFNPVSGDEITAKEAFVAVLDPDTYLADNPIVDDPGSEQPIAPIDGVYVYDTSKGDAYSGANIILGNDANQWPWSTAGEDGKVAFTPEKDATYRITVNYTSLGTSALRVRWIKDESNGGYTAQDGQVVGTAPHSNSLTPDQVATMIPAYFNSGMSAGNSYTLVTEIKLDGAQQADGLIGNIAIRGGAGGNSFSINELIVEKVGAEGEEDTLLVNWPEGLPKAGTEGVHVYSVTDGDSWSGANIITGNNASKWPWSTAGEDGKVAFIPEKDATYRIAVNYTSMGTSAIRVRWLKDDSNGGYTAQDGQSVNDNQYSASEVATKIPAYFNNGMVNAGTYTLNTEIKFDGSQPADGLIGNIAIRGGAGGNSFLINWIKVEKLGTDGAPDTLLVNWPEGIDEPVPQPEPEEPGLDIPPAGQTYENYPALKDVYKDYFSVGIFGAGENNALIHNYASYAPGNEMKPESTQREKGNFTYTSADNAFNNLASKNPDMLFYGHTLAWHSQSPTWMWDAPPARYDQPGTFDRDTALENLNHHIENVLGYYGDRLVGVDVVNEAVGTANPNDWKASLAKGEGWYMALGWEWVELAFLKAAEVVDSNGWDTKLIYNDFGLDSPNKARVVYEMVKDINERYADVRPNGKPLIEVIGMQAHYNLTTNPENVENNIKLFATLPGVTLNITEMDIGTPPIGTLTPENENNQAMKYAELFHIYKKYAAGPANVTDNPKVIERIAISGVRDAVTGWRAGEFALLFDSNGLAKEALVAVLDPEAYLETHQYIEPEPEPELTPVDGVYVYDAGKGDAWTGANIILGDSADEWPWSTAGGDGKVAFTPEKDATYRLSFNYTAKGTTAIRVRWVKDDSNGGYTDADGALVNEHQYAAGDVATKIPAYFNSGMVNSGSYTLVTEIKLDGSEPANGLIGNIAIRGGGGGNAYSINWLKIEKLDSEGEVEELLVNWPNTDGLAPAVPAEVSAQAKGASEIELSWKASDRATGYNIYRSDAADGAYNKINTETVTETTYVDTGLEANSTYYYKVTAVSGEKESEKSDHVAATTSGASSVMYYEGFENGNTLQQNGDATINRTEEHAAAGTSSLSVAPTAANNYSGVALRNSALTEPMLPGGTYKLTAKALSAKDATLGVRVETKDAAGGDTYGTVGRATVNLTAGEWADISLEFTVPTEHQSVSAIVFHNDAQISDFTFYLDEVTLQLISPPVPEEPGEPEEPELKEVLRIAFDNKAEHEALFTSEISSAIEWIDEAGVGMNDSTALKVTHIADTSYTSADNAVRLTLANPLPEGGVYNISVSFFAPAEGNEGKGVLTGPGIVLNQDYANSASKLPSNPGTLPIGEWKEVNVQTPLMDRALETIDFRLVTNDAANHADVWYIDQIVIHQVGDLKEIPKWDLSLTSIADTYKDYFLIGNVMSPSQTTDDENTAMYKHHYNSMTPENEMKPQYLSSAKGVYNYRNADTLIEWAEANDINVHGHTLVWHSQSAPWLTNGEDNQPLTRAEAKANMEEYISNVAGHYKGKLASWDVVNEAFDGGRSIPTDWKTVLRKNSPWYLAYENGADESKGESGADYIYDAFVYARLADPDATLYYNDYNENEPWKREAMALMAEELNEKWKTDERNTDPERLLVEGIGMQAHYWIQSLDPATVEASIARFVEAGVKVSITELDIPSSTGTLTEEDEAKQAELYAKLFVIFKKYASDIERVTIWGKADSQSWRASGSPLLFDRALVAKPAYYAVIDPEGYLNMEPVIEAPTGVTALSKSSSEIEVSWTAIEGASGYNVYRSTTADGSYVKVNTQLINDTKFLDRGLLASTTYYYKVKSVNDAGESLLSSAAHAVTDIIYTGPGTPPTTPPAPVESDELKAEVDSNGLAKATVKAEHLKKGLSEAKAGTLKLAVAGVDNAKQITVSILAEQVKEAKEAGIKRIELSLGLATVELPIALLEGIADTDNIQLSVAIVDNSTLSEKARELVGANTVYDFTLSVNDKNISDFGPGQQVKVEIPYTLKTGENPHQIVLYYLSDEGSIEVIKNARYNKDTGKVVFKTKHFSKYAPIANPVQFQDAKAVAWASDSIEGLAARGIVNGVTKDSFAPNDSVTRAEFIHMLMLALDLDAANATSSFSDVQQDAWYYHSVAAAQQLGIVNGHKDGSFGVSDKITRQEMAAMTYRAIQTAGLTLNEQALTAFSDEQDIANYAKEAVSAMQKAGIINGVGNGKFAPQDTATRAQAAVILYQLLMETL